MKGTERVFQRVFQEAESEHEKPSKELTKLQVYAEDIHCIEELSPIEKEIFKDFGKMVRLYSIFGDSFIVKGSFPEICKWHKKMKKTINHRNLLN